MDGNKSLAQLRALRAGASQRHGADSPEAKTAQSDYYGAKLAADIEQTLEKATLSDAQIDGLVGILKSGGSR